MAEYKNEIKRDESDKAGLFILQCRACRRFIGYSHRSTLMFCDDIWCLTTREWVWDIAGEANDFLIYLVDVEGHSIADIARKLDVDRDYLHKMHRNRRRQGLYTLM